MNTNNITEYKTGFSMIAYTKASSRLDLVFLFSFPNLVVYKTVQYNYDAPISFIGRAQIIGNTA
jgi:hypothetical protein